MIAADPTLGKPLAGAEDYLRVEAVYAVTHEGARHLEDGMTRRMHISIETWDRGVSAAQEVATLMAGPMKGWYQHGRKVIPRLLLQIGEESDEREIGIRDSTD